MKGTSCCNECGASEYCYFSGNKTRFSETGIAATFAISISTVKCCKHMLSVEKNMCIWPLAFTLGSDVLQGHAAMKGTSCCNECGAVEHCYFRGDKAKFSDKGIAVMSYKVMLLWREHPAAMSAVPVSTATSVVIKRSSVRQALLQRLPSAFPLWSAANICCL